MMFLEIGLKDHFKLKKFMKKEIEFNQTLKFLLKNQIAHSCKNIKYKKFSKIIKDYIDDYYKNYTSNKFLKLGNICKINFPLFSMGAINSKHLFGIDEIIIFCFYFINKNKYKKVYDLGSNIGMHSLILSKLNYKVFSYEPDPIHINQQKKNLKINKQDQKVKLFKKAVTNYEGTVKFLKVLGNTTGNHILGDKKDVYGKTKIISVKTDDFKKIISNADLIKIDVEGHEAELILSTSSVDWNKTEAIMEIGSKENAKKIFEHCKKIDLNIFSQVSGWKKVINLQKMPTTYKKGSVFLSKTNKMNWR
jgi:FkbM family methyltransferase